jgi:hypothetical protein
MARGDAGSSLAAAADLLIYLDGGGTRSVSAAAPPVPS